MKKYLSIFLLPLMAACVKSPKESVISGILKNDKDTVVSLTSKGITEKVKLNADKTFTFKITIDKPVLYTIKTGRKTNVEFYVNPGDVTEIAIDFENLSDGAKFTGKLEAVNNYLPEKEKIIKKYITNFNAVFGLEEDQFNLKLDSLNSELLKNAKTLPKRSIAELEKYRVDYLIKGMKANYPEYNAYVNSVEFNSDSADYSVLEGLDLNNAHHLIFSDYSELVNKSIMNKFVKENGAKALETMPVVDRLTKMFALIDANITNAEVRDYLKENVLIEDLSYGEFWKLSDLVNTFFAECQTVGYKNIIEKLYNQKMLLAPGKPAPLFKYNDINGKEYSLESLKGKLVYIDFWATWCGPCRHELPFLEEVEKAYEGKKVTFISMSMDDDMFAWDKMVKEKKMKGLQLHADGAWNSTVAKDYQIKGIPTFVLIDENGLIISPAAPRPSSGADLVNMLDENLAKIK